MHPGALNVVADLLLVSVAFLVLAAAGLAFAVALQVSSRPAQAIFALATPCLTAYAASGFYLLSPVAGRVAAITAYVGVAAAGTGVGSSFRDQMRLALRWWAAPVLMTVAAAAVGLGFGFLHGGTSFPLREAEIRYIHRLANDNVLPSAFAHQLLGSRRPLPRLLSPDAPWRSSDRPPLQTSLYLMIRAVLPMGDPAHLLYQTLGTFLQSLWMPALWCLLYVSGAPRRLVVGALMTVLLSGFVIFNSFYVWPKLLPAAFLVLLVALVLTPEWRQERARAKGGLACGLAAGCALLGHEGSALVLIPLLVLLLASRRSWPSVKSAATAAASLVALLLPWTLYQRYYDPPGTLLTKVQLAGPVTFDPHKGLLAAIVDAYRRLGVTGVLSRKWDNLTMPFAHELTAIKDAAIVVGHVWAGSGPATHALEQLRNLTLYDLLPTLGLIALGPIAYVIVAVGRTSKDPDLHLDRALWLLLAACILFWALVLIAPHATTNANGSFALELLAFSAGAISLWRLSPSWALELMALQIALSVLTFVLLSPRLPYMVPAPGGVHFAELALAVVGVVGAALLAMRAPTRTDTARLTNLPARQAGVAA